MKQSVDFYSFLRAFEQTRPENFSREGLIALFDYFENLERDLGEEIELDVIAICCDYSEDIPEFIATQYDIDLSGHEDDDSKMDVVADWLQDNGVFVGQTESTIIYNVNF